MYPLTEAVDTPRFNWRLRQHRTARNVDPNNCNGSISAQNGISETLPGASQATVKEWVMTSPLRQLSNTRHAKAPLIITGCCARKRVAPQISFRDMSPQPQPQFSATWLKLIADHPPSGKAMDLYAGRGFALAMRAAQIIEADVAIVSAGLGIVMATTAIPSYDLTLGRGGIRTRVQGTFDLPSWWHSVLGGPYSSDLDAEIRGRPIVLACVTRAYAPLIADTLARYSADTDLRIFGQGLKGVLPAALHAAILPYDDRLGKASSNGTQSDFAQRALMHFATDIYPNSSRDLGRDVDAVRTVLKGVARPDPIPRRAKADDAELKAVIARLISVVGPRKNAMLRYLRDKEGVACEQGRFARLFAEVVRH